MKIAFVLPVAFPGIPPKFSIPILNHELASRMAARGHEVTVYTLRKQLSDPISLDYEGVVYRCVGRRLDGILMRVAGLQRRLKRWFRLDSRRHPFYLSSLHHLGYAFSVALDLRKQAPDVIHVHNASNYLPVLRWLNPRSKLVLHMHCEWLNQLAPATLRRRLESVDMVLGCSEYIVERARQCFQDSDVIWRALPNGVDIDLFAPGSGTRSKPESRISLLFVGRVSPEKGVHVILAAFEQVAKDHPEIELVIVGQLGSCQYDFLIGPSGDPVTRALGRFYPEPKSSPASKEYYARHLRTGIPGWLADRITFTGELPYAEVVGQYRNADIFVFPSISEAFGMPVVEAMATGLPVITARAGGLTEIVETEKTGLLVEREDALGLAEALSRLVRDRALRESMGRAGRQRAIEKYSWDVIVNDLEQSYQQLLA